MYVPSPTTRSAWMKARGVRRNRHLWDRLLHHGEQHTCESQGGRICKNPGSFQVCRIDVLSRWLSLKICLNWRSKQPKIHETPRGDQMSRLRRMTKKIWNAQNRYVWKKLKRSAFSLRRPLCFPEQVFRFSAFLRKSANHNSWKGRSFHWGRSWLTMRSWSLRFSEELKSSQNQRKGEPTLVHLKGKERENPTFKWFPDQPSAHPSTPLLQMKCKIYQPTSLPAYQPSPWPNLSSCSNLAAIQSARELAIASMTWTQSSWNTALSLELGALSPIYNSRSDSLQFSLSSESNTAGIIMLTRISNSWSSERICNWVLETWNHGKFLATQQCGHTTCYTLKHPNLL